LPLGEQRYKETKEVQLNKATPLRYGEAPNAICQTSSAYNVHSCYQASQPGYIGITGVFVVQKYIPKKKAQRSNQCGPIASQDACCQSTKQHYGQQSDAGTDPIQRENYLCPLIRSSQQPCQRSGDSEAKQPQRSPKEVSQIPERIQCKFASTTMLTINVMMMTFRIAPVYTLVSPHKVRASQSLYQHIDKGENGN